MIQAFVFAVLVAVMARVADAECANACNGHGRCTSYDMCICNRNWQASDCSERVCMFGLAHVDTPKGDLDGSGDVTGSDTRVIENSFTYPYGTTEQFPVMEDSDNHVISDTAHYYMECSNKGTCSRTTGECQCFDGYDGVACQRASCPGYPSSCSGHGVCKTIRQLAAADYGNVYELWDKDVTMGCECDHGYSGPDCSLRECKHGVDPLYMDDAATVKYGIFDFGVLSTLSAPSTLTGLFTDGQYESKNGQWAIRFYDSHGEDWLTEPISAGASCSEVVAALEAIPNTVIPAGETQCTRTEPLNIVSNKVSDYDDQHPSTAKHPYPIAYKIAFWESYTSIGHGEQGIETATTVYKGSNDTSTAVTVSGYIYRLKFFGNPGALREPEIEIYLDGRRPSLVSPGAKVVTKVWTDGQQGESNDYFADHCDGVTVNIGHTTASVNGYPSRVSYLTGFTEDEKNRLKKCLGCSDFDESNNVDVYNWDYGNKFYPHLIKLVRTVTTLNDGGYYAVVWYDTAAPYNDNLHASGTFRLLNPFSPPDNFLTDNYDVYTTKGTLALTTNQSEATFGFASKYIYTTNVTYDTRREFTNQTYSGDLSCEVGANNGDKHRYLFHCLNVSDMFTLINWEYPQYNPPHINLYTAKRLYKGPFQHNVDRRFANWASKPDLEMHYQTHYITTDIATNWGQSVGYTSSATPNGLPQFGVYKFFPAAVSTYEYVAPCSNRGICDTSAGVCKCFPGYTTDACNDQSSLAV